MAHVLEGRYDYGEVRATSERITWRVEDLIGGELQLDFRRPFLPETLARVEPLEFLDDCERLALNQIRGHSYLCLFGLVEEFIVPFVLDHARPQLGADADRDRALLQFAAEETKHIHLFRSFRAEFESSFGHCCGVIGPARAIAREVLDHEPLAVALTILQIEWMTQLHYTESLGGAQDLDPRFLDLLRHHWMEETNHAKLDTLVVGQLAATASDEEIGSAVDGYLAIAAFLDTGLAQQVELDLQALQCVTGRRLTDGEREICRVVQHQANRYTFLGSGMRHERFRETLAALSPAALAAVDRGADRYLQ